MGRPDNPRDRAQTELTDTRTRLGKRIWITESSGLAESKERLKTKKHRQ